VRPVRRTGACGLHAEHRRGLLYATCAASWDVHAGAAWRRIAGAVAEDEAEREEHHALSIVVVLVIPTVVAASVYAVLCKADG